MSEICLTNIKNLVTGSSSASKIRAKILVTNGLNINLSGVSKLRFKGSLKLGNKCNISSTGKIKESASLSHGLFALSDDNITEVKATLIVNGNIKSRLSSSSSFKNIYVDKLAGYIDNINSIDFDATEKLYPIRDIVSSYNNSIFVDKLLNSGNLFDSINEGVAIGNYSKFGRISKRISDDKNSYIQPSSIFTSGNFRYKCEVSPPTDDGQNSFIFIRASAPISTYVSDIPPQYTISNIKLEDPSGNLIVKYKDITLRGDADYSQDYTNFSTYISEPETNNFLLRSWDSSYPLIGEASGYTLNLDFTIQCLDDPFNEGFNKGYEDTCINTLDHILSHTNLPLNISNSLRISAIEIANSGDRCVDCSGRGIKRDAYLGFNVEVDPIGRRLTRSILPVEVIPYNINLDIYPEASSVWVSSPDSFSNVAYNTSTSGSRILTSKLQNDAPYDYITLLSTGPISDSGRLSLKFSHQPPTSVQDYEGGAFTLGYDNANFNSANFTQVEQVDNFFTVDSLELRVVAKKAVGSRDYALDIVGYSDDKVINITPKLGAFLQNTETPIGSVPQVSGFKSIDDLGISSESISDKNQYFTRDLVSNSGKDHYVLSTSPVVNSTTFQTYTIPLTIHEDNVELGKSIDYSMSSYFENLYLDIFPIPSGASISTVQLLVKYKPSNALQLSTFAQAAKDLAYRTTKIYPSSRQSLDNILNSPSSVIENLPHGFKTPASIKSNYARRWHGVDGKITNGPYHAAEFDFGFQNPEIEYPFLSGFYNFNYDTNNVIRSVPLGNNLGQLTGTFNGSYNNSKINNLGLRFKNTNLFAQQLPGYSGSYSTIDWTSLSSGTSNFANHPLRGKIVDSFENAIRISGVNGNINFGKVDTSNGFAIYTRFSPDSTVSGINYNLFNSGVIFSQWDAGANQGFALGYENGFLCATVNVSGTILKIKDTIQYHQYQFPLSTMLTFKEFRQTTTSIHAVTLYADNEADSGNFNIIRAALAPIGSLNNLKLLSFNPSGSDLIFGYCPASGVGMNMFLSEIGISLHHPNANSYIEQLYKNRTNLTSFKPLTLARPDIAQYFAPSDRDNVYKISSIQDFFAGVRNKYFNNSEAYTNDRSTLWSYVDEDVSNWHIGDFKICSFSADFDGMTQRDGTDYITHSLKHSGSGYSTLVNLPLPSNVYASGLAYHTQIENDFLRFNLSDIPEDGSFYSASPRISKSLPRGYNFEEESFAVDTVLEYESFNDIVWEDGSVGPKLIVSLYSPNQENSDLPSKINWGLINRSTHYLEPSGCWQKLTSKFTYNDLVDLSEPWAKFDLDNNITEFDHKYYSKDINKMFLQYDLAFPSGSPFESKIKIHSSHIRLNNSLVTELPSSASLNLVASGEKKWLENINLYVDSYGISSSTPSGLSLYGLAEATPITSSIMNISMSGVSGIPYNNINLFTLNKNTLDSSSSILFGSAYDQEYYFGPNLYVSGRSNKFAEQILPLIVQNNLIDQMASGNLSLSTYNIISSDYVNNSFPLYIKSYPQLISSFNRESVNLFTSVDNFTDFYKASSQQNFNLFILGLDLKTYGSGLFNLFTINYPASNQSLSSQSTISWNGNNSGKNIDVDDNSLAYVDADDEIRGVDLLCYGSCPTGLCKEDIVSIHEVNWSTPSLCSDGGIFRAKQTYTNLSLPSGSFKHTLPTSSYDQLVTEDSFVISSENGSLFITESSDSVVYDPMPYSGHFYGIRKYTGLVPNSPYAINIVGKTGSNNSITLPKEFTEMEYGIDSEVAYSGIKIVNDDYRESGVKFGKSIAVKKDLIAIGSPFQNLEYQEYNTDGNLTTITLNDAGSIFLYRRDARPSDYTWPQNTAKSSWNLETRLSLPSGLLKDYPTISTVTKIDDTDLPLPVTVRSWNVGQEGRRLGHSIDLAINSEVKSFEEDSRQIIVAGGPTASWSRDFEDLQTSGVQIGLIIFTDEFSPQVGYDPVKKRPKNYTDVLESIKNKDLLYRYYSDPPIQFNVKLIICEPIIGFSDSIVEFPAPQPDFIVKKQIYRNDGPPNADQTSRILSGIKEAFHEAFPYDTSKIHNNVPPLVGLYVDNSDSLGLDALNPALNQFIDYYKKYSFDNGLTDFYGVRSSGSLFSYEPSEGGGEDWITMSQSILDEVLDTGRLLIDNQVRFLTSGVGEQYFNQNLKEFNYPPESGGRVYIFEKESGSWNLVQEIKSPNITYSTPDRFGHAVAISDDSEIIAIGSPYIDQACQVFEYKPEEKARLYSGLYSWLQYKNSATGGLLSKYSQLINQFSSWSSEYGYTYATYILYSKLDSTDKFEARQYLNIQEYQNIYTYSYSHIGSIGDTWNFIPDHFAPTSRLGYSVAVNEDGTLVAFGSPTDSFNEYEDNNVYYKNDGYSDPSNDENLNTNIIKPNWRSSTNAGAVRIFESRRYYPHDTVVEFTKFGNLQESMKYPEDSGHFNYLASIFNDKNFRKTEFTEVDIPQNAGLAFIITPEVDALSDEVADNILNWLALGDRNLVLVGNDPIWEKNGIYSISNNIINKILTKLESRIKLYPARNSYEALSSGCSLAIPSYRPANSSSSYVQSYDLKAYGVADIRMNIGNNLINRYMPCPDPSDDTLLNDKCEMPLKDIGDLRAEWTESCLNCAGQEVLYKVNWPFIFKTYTPPCCDTEPLDNDPSRQDWHNQEPIPLLVAADYVTETIVIPYSPASSGLRPIYETIAVGTPINIFDYNNISPSAINIWDSGNNIYSALSINDNQSRDMRGLFYTPSIFEDRQALYQANAIPLQEIVESKQEVSDHGYYCIEETHSNLTSKTIFIAGLATESKNQLNYNTSDKNIRFYTNLISRDGKSVHIAQLGSWTGRNNFTDAYADSYLEFQFRKRGHTVSLGVNKLDHYAHDVCWIANPAGLPSSEELLSLKSWLLRPNKKLIITYDNNISSAIRIKQLSDLLNSNIKPLYLTVSDEYAKSYASSLTFNVNHPVSTGYNSYSSIQSFITEYSIEFIPLVLAPNTTAICFADPEIYDKKFDTIGYWKMDTGVTKLSIPSISGSGYKLFFTTISETPSENQPLSFVVENATRSPGLPYGDSTGLGVVYAKDNYVISSVGDLYVSPYNQLANIPVIYSVDVQPISSSDINIYIYNITDRLSVTTSDYQPKTTRLLSVSGVAIPVIGSTSFTLQQRISGLESYEIAPERPEEIIVTQRLMAISNDNSQYCDTPECAVSFGNRMIADGPVIAAQEPEHFSTFMNGVARSRITLLSDSSLVQGQCMGDEFFRSSAESVAFIRSLYPETSFPDTNFGRQYTVMTKILSPERGSPQKYLSALLNSGICSRFGGSGIPLLLSSFEDKESRYDPKFVIRPKNPWPEDATDQQIEQIKRQYISQFSNDQINNGGTAMFSGVIDGKLYRDATRMGGIPEILKDKGYDYLDFDMFPSGYPGDLFGHSIGLYKEKLIVGSPFNAFKDNVLSSWNEIISENGSGLTLGYDGGAGSVYIFERNMNGSGLHDTQTPWQFTQKLRPSTINISDQFGYDLDIDGDIIVVGSPSHEYGNLEINGSGAFVRRSFNDEFNIPSRNVIDLGSSGISGIYDRGALFTFENKITDWTTKKQEWTYVEKIVAKDSAIKIRDHFGRSVYIDKSNRSDSDYVIAAGSENHDYSSVNDNPLSNAGAAYTNDIVLRNQAPVQQSPNAYIDAKFFGERDPNGLPFVRLVFSNSSGVSQSHVASGLIYSNSQGEIFVEASGQDPVRRGFIEHRPYIESVDGLYYYGFPNSGNMPLFIEGKRDVQQNLNIFTNVDDTSNVYNTLGLYNTAIIDFASDLPSGMMLYVHTPEPTSISESGLCLSVSGIGINTDTLNLRIRGK